MTTKFGRLGPLILANVDQYFADFDQIWPFGAKLGPDLAKIAPIDQSVGGGIGFIFGDNRGAHLSARC